jgi:hypothetical protein
VIVEPTLVEPWSMTGARPTSSMTSALMAVSIGMLMNGCLPTSMRTLGRLNCESP